VHAPPGLESALVARLYTQANAARWSVSEERFGAALSASLAHARASADLSTALDPERYLSALHLADLALAVACGDGHDGAWEHFIAEHKSILTRAAMAIDPSRTSQLAESLYAELFGLQQKGGERQSLFRYFHGRSRLATWLRAILAQRHVDHVRATRRLEPLPDDEDRSGLPALVAKDRSSTPEGERLRFLNAMREALASAIADLAPKDRLRLSCYYARDMTLAAIGRMLGEHEATVSRHLTRTRREIRTAAEARLRDEHGMDDRAMAECFVSVTEDAGALDLGELFGTRTERKAGGENRSEE
jgi:RNA polymerase sigma-70 factor, ECF subfamily